MVLSAGKIAEVYFDKFIETYEHQMLMLQLVDGEQPDASKLQNAGNTTWYPVQQHRPILTGFDLTGQEQGIIEETYPISLGDPNNDLIEQRVDDLRDMRFWERAGTQAGYQQATQLNKDLADLIANTGSLYFEQSLATSTSGFDFISEGQALINERQVYKDQGMNFLLNPRDSKNFSQDLAGRQTVRGRPEDTWLSGQIGSNVAEFDVFTGSFTPNLAAPGAGGSTVAVTVSERPEGGTVDAVTKVVTNVDYRVGTISLVDGTGYNVGDVVSFPGVNAVGLADKTDSNQLMTFKIVGKSGNDISVYPKPIAADDPGLTALEQAYANINTQITATTACNVVNTAAGRSNLFWCKDSIQLIGGEVPWDLAAEFAGMKVISSQLAGGVTAYMIYDSNMVSATFRYRCFVWYGLGNRNPMANGSAITTP
ncbi:MAG: hypothetical protein CMI54_04600 [Parcubacteria group bacterium]|nr:hypothetical protein [Parcubacteria group bacterium]|tara:strand:+ start:17124 stop:18398 length:1275 start_codon:yes stop_codon:yes gene_type:complete